MTMDELRYPIGKFNPSQEISIKNRKKWIKTIRRFPKKIRAAVKKLNDEQLDTPYRPGGWTIRQVVHHVADSHINSYVRFKWTLTEDTPEIKAYEQEGWAELPDAKTGPIKPSLTILEGVHQRWYQLLKSMSDEDFARELTHPEWDFKLSLNRMLSLYAWHCKHHLAHITNLTSSEEFKDES